jgi:hypothetical protein
LFKKYGHRPTVTFLNRENENCVTVYEKVLEAHGNGLKNPPKHRPSAQEG